MNSIGIEPVRDPIAVHRDLTIFTDYQRRCAAFDRHMDRDLGRVERRVGREHVDIVAQTPGQDTDAIPNAESQVIILYADIARDRRSAERVVERAKLPGHALDIVPDRA